MHKLEKATKAAKANMAQIKNSVLKYFDADLIRLLYVPLVRLQFAVLVWNPYL